LKKIFIIFLLPITIFSKDIDQMIGEMLIVGVPGDSVNQKWIKRLREDISNKRVGGVIFFKRNIKSKKELKRLINFLSPKNLKIKPFIAIDEEGGQVSRLFGIYRSPLRVANELNLNETHKMYSLLAEELKSYGFNLNFAPVVDLNLEKNSPAIGAKHRSYSSYEEIVIAYSGEFIRALREKNIISVIKHFPGHGSALKDSHKGFVDISNSWNFRELKPYYYFIKNKKVDAIMVGHLYLKQLDRDNLSTFSEKTIKGLLREKLKFNGVVFSDDMLMGAIVKNYTLKEAVINSINAGIDVLLFSSYFTKNSSIVNDVTRIIKDAIKDGKIKKEDIIDSYNRIIKLKERL